jgi:hypothetical protein
VLNTLRKRTFAHHWAIVRRSALNSAIDTEEANVRLELGDRSLPRQAPKDERSSPSYTHTLARRRTFAQHWAIIRPRGKCPHVTYLGHFHLIYPSLSPTFTYPTAPAPRRPRSHRLRTPQPTTRHPLNHHNHHKTPHWPIYTPTLPNPISIHIG